MGEKAAAFAGWAVGIVLALYVAFVAAYGLLAPECVTDADVRDARLMLAVNAVMSVVTIAGAVYLAVRARRAFDGGRRFLTGPVFASAIVGLYLTMSLVLSVVTARMDVPGPTAACF